MHPLLQDIFKRYPKEKAPFMHDMLASWQKEKPLKNLKVAHHVPLVMNTLLKIACLVEAGAIVTVTNPSDFMQADEHAIAILKHAGIRFVSSLDDIKDETFDVFFDCGAELYQALKSPRLGAIELTGSGDMYYRDHQPDFTVVSIDRTLTKQLETVFGCAKSIREAMMHLDKSNHDDKRWLIFGFGKIGRGLAYFCKQKNINVTVVDVNKAQLQAAEALGLRCIDANELDALRKAVLESDVIITATGVKHALNQYPRDWFDEKIMANMGVYDEFGPKFKEEDVLNSKQPINFSLEEPTPIEFIDPEFYLHNLAALSLLLPSITRCVMSPSLEIDEKIITKWCTHHDVDMHVIKQWFVDYRSLAPDSFGTQVEHSQDTLQAINHACF